ncbi:MAG: phytanoyl-CoA dioxygenase [Blastopirellula sp.]|nr:MAG: phytanoyl-CoA dioxygenase [Blastopirellula sp.]
MPQSLEQSSQQVTQRGFTVLRDVYNSAEMQTVRTEIDTALSHAELDAGPIRSRQGRVYAARNVLELYPDVADVWKRTPLVQLLLNQLGNDCGLVRVLYFDKPSDQSWSLPWHKDLTIAVKDNQIKSQQFTKPTTKAGVPHVEASLEVLQAMLTLRIHLDDADAGNGALKVIPGSQLSGKQAVATSDEQVHLVEARAGGVLAMSPLISHASGEVQDAGRHRRILHLEFCGIKDLPDGFEWNHFLPVCS